MTHAEREECMQTHLSECEHIRKGKGIEYSNSTEDANLNFKSDSDIGVTPLQSCSVLMNKHYRSVRSFVNTGTIYSDEKIQGRLHDLINYSLIMLSLIEEHDQRTV